MPVARGDRLVGFGPNGIKLASERLLDQLSAQFLSGFNHQGEALGSPLLDPRLHTIGACRVHDQRDEWHAGTWCAEPPQRIEAADPLHGAVLAYGGVPHDHADQGVDHGTDGQLLQHARYGLTGQHSQPPRGLEVRQRGLDLPTLAVPFGEVGHTVDFRVEARGHQGDLAGSAAWAADVVAPLSEPSRRWQGRQRFPGEPRGTGLGC
jgi:hypothetical protein